jgi:hypothetical protein
VTKRTSHPKTIDQTLEILHDSIKSLETIASHHPGSIERSEREAPHASARAVVSAG